MQVSEAVYRSSDERNEMIKILAKALVKLANEDGVGFHQKIKIEDAATTLRHAV